MGDPCPPLATSNICGNFYSQLQAWSQATGLGRACMGVGVIFSDSNDVIPDVVWLSMEKYTALIDDAGHVRGHQTL
ncbi:Uma2 family endonuclease [Thermosynechococcus sichuanensis]|uniref:Uma2 family endonuclease n=1 Tax=Thermosynechococcus sichuanensis TaxID=3161974 RepID=UPI0034D97B6F